MWTYAWMDWYIHYFHHKPVLHVSLTEGMIPAVLFKTGACEQQHLPSTILELYRKIESDNPGYRVVYFSDARARHFMVENCPAYLNAYDTLVPAAYKADLFRLCVLYIHGGVYGDFSQQYLVKLDTLVDRHRNELVLTLDGAMPSYPDPYKYRGINNSFMASRPKNTFLAYCMDRIVHHVKIKYYGMTPLCPTGPGLLRRILDEHPETPYRMDISMFGSNGIYNLGTHQKVIIHKLKGHYKQMKRQRKQPKYSHLWFTRKIYN